LAARDDGWLGRPGVAVDLGCGLGTEAGFLAVAGWAALGVDLSPAAVRGAAQAHPDARFMLADVLSLPLASASADLLLDRGCFHYLVPADRCRYAREARRVLRRGGRFLLRACQSAVGVPNDIDQAMIEHIFGDWHLARITRQDIVSDTRRMPALVARLNAPG
jgi:SAM-dependent methyltransferase